MYKFAVALCCFFFLVSAAHANKQMLTEAEQELVLRLEHMQWEKSISPEDRLRILEGLSSEKDDVAAPALTAAVVIQIEGLPAALQRGVGPENGIVRLLADSILQCMTQGSPIDKCILATSIEDIAPAGAPHVKNLLQRQVSHMVAIYRSRRLRSGNDDVASSVTLTYEDQMLLQYSRMPRESAIGQILNSFKGTTVIDGEKSAQMEVLRSYEVDLDTILEALRNSQTSPYGKILFLRYLNSRSLFVNESERASIRTVLDGMAVQDAGVEREIGFTRQFVSRWSAAGNSGEVYDK